MVVGVGFDLVEIERVDRMIASLGDRMFTRLFSPGEADYIRSKPLPAQHAAVRQGDHATVHGTDGDREGGGVEFSEGEQPC